MHPHTLLQTLRDSFQFVIVLPRQDLLGLRLRLSINFFELIQKILRFLDTIELAQFQLIHFVDVILRLG